MDLVGWRIRVIGCVYNQYSVYLRVTLNPKL